MATDETQLGKRRTAQRDAILRVIRTAAGPLTVKEIHQRARRSRRSLGRATVYRTVRLLLESDRIRVITLPDGDTRYETADLGHHCHFHCRACKRVYDLDACMVSIPNGTTLPEGFRVEGHELTLRGTCPSCSRS